MGIPRSTIKNWITKFKNKESYKKAGGDEIGIHNALKKHRPLGLAGSSPALSTIRSNYSFLLGMYLGDGYIIKFPRTYRMVISCHKKQVEIINEIKIKLKSIFVNNKVSTLDKKSNCTIVGLYSCALPEIFPQHKFKADPRLVSKNGKNKHAKNIYLLKWQKRIVKEYPLDFLRGLMYSDGTVIRPRKGEPANGIEFVNKSKDICELFVKYFNKHYKKTIQVNYNS